MRVFFLFSFSSFLEYGIANFRGWRRAAKKKENKRKKETHHTAVCDLKSQTADIPHIITFFAIIMLFVSIVIKNNLELTVDFLGIVYLLIECIWVGMGKECPSLVHLFD